MIIPSITECGSPSSTLRSMNAPGSPSSALQIMYLSSPGDFRANPHLVPVGNPAPPRPLMPEAETSSMTSSGVMAVSAFRAASYPPIAMYSSMVSGFIFPQLRSTTRCWLARKSPSPEPGSSLFLTTQSSMTLPEAHVLLEQLGDFLRGHVAVDDGPSVGNRRPRRRAP